MAADIKLIFRTYSQIILLTSLVTCMFLRNINSVLIEHQTGVMEGTGSNPIENVNVLSFLLLCNAFTTN